MVKVAVVQTDPAIGEIGRNIALIEDTLETIARSGAKLAVFPECALTGYMYGSLEEALGVAEPVPGPSARRIAAATERLGVYAVVGMLEREGHRCFNTALLAGPRGIEAVYRKTHTLCLGVDRFTTPGDIPYRVHNLPFGRIGILICYDLRFPEAARALSLERAQAILLPTNWPVSSRVQPDVLTRARAAENRVFVLAADRVGSERGARFLGRSQIVDPTGTVVQEAGPTNPEVLLAEVDLTEADRKHVVLQPGVHEMDLEGDRRPDLYGTLIAGAAAPVT
ncbi:MAG TPA: carbon-nitrogen hydrolase family protein [Chloroflexota bacterium]|nr:carbon-nitrogen hydrolase family protein [Chloroflexota bacterium]